MNIYYLFSSLYFIGTLLLIRSLVLAIGRGKKWFANENFLLWQKLSAIAFLASLLARIFYPTPDLFYAIVALVLIGIFYLQPTPRISKYILVLFSVLTLVYFLTSFRLFYLTLVQLALGFY